MNLTLDIENILQEEGIGSEYDFETWVKLALGDRQQDTELSIRLVGEKEIQTLNKQYRNKDKPTNVLSFPAVNVPGMPESHIGDLIICVPVVVREAFDQEKTEKAHFAHITIHGILHLLGYDHQNDDEAREMESLEVRLLEQLGIDNPYEEKQ